MKKIITKIDGHTIFDIKYLMSGILTDEDLNLLLNTSSLNRSLILAEYRLIGDKDSVESIFKKCKKDEFWYDNTSWTNKQQDEFRNILLKVYHNIYYYSEKRCSDLADMWILNFGFKCKDE